MLDFVILGDAGRPSAEVSLDVEDHFSIVSKARECGLRIFGRLQDYYAHSEIAVDELDAFKNEITVLQMTPQMTDTASSFFAKLQALADQAKAESKSVHILAD